MATLTGLTIEDFETLPEELAKNRELVDGELVVVPGNTAYHNSLRDYLIELLRPYAREHNLGKVMSEQEFAFGENAHGPDVSFLGRDKVAYIDGERRVQIFVPDLAIEIASTNDRVGPTLQKLRRYRECGTKEVWFLIAFTREATLYSDEGDRILHENDEFRSALLPGFSILLKDLFDRA